MGRGRPRGEDTRRELLARYSVVVQAAAPLFTFLYENQAALRELSIGQRLKDQMRAMWDLFIDPEADLPEQARAVSALLTVHFGSVSMRDLPGSAEAKRVALLNVATEAVCGRD